MTELLLTLGLIAGVVVAHTLGYWLGSLTRSTDEPFDRQVALVRTATGALVAFLIGFAFSGAASRFIERLEAVNCRSCHSRHHGDSDQEDKRLDARFCLCHCESPSQSAGVLSACPLASILFSAISCVFASDSQVLARTSHAHLFWLSSPRFALRRHSLASMRLPLLSDIAAS